MFDIFGILLPGIIFLILITTPLLLFDHEKVSPYQIESSKILSILTNLSGYVDYSLSHQTKLVILAGLLISYILGHLLKVLSIIQYEFFSAIFDDFLNNLVSRFLNWLKRPFVWIIKKIFGKNTNGYIRFRDQIIILWKPFLSLIQKIFTFSSPKYFSDNDSLKDECIIAINKKYDTNFPLKWYSLFKFSTVIHNQENIKSLTQMFLAKYNFYRSMAFSFIMTFFYYMVFFSSTSNYLSNSIKELKGIILIFLILLWITFHYKYKRYWTLCGNESLVSLYYYLKKTR